MKRIFMRMRKVEMVEEVEMVEMVEEVEMVEMVEEVEMVEKVEAKRRFVGMEKFVIVMMVVLLAQTSVSPQARMPVCPQARMSVSPQARMSVCPQARMPVSPYPLLISEIMPDPDPPVGLPGYEYAEWYNAGTGTVNLAGWSWVVGEEAGNARIGKVMAGGPGVQELGPGQYVIVCGKSAATALMPFGPVAVVDPFPALKNGGDRLTLIDPEGRIVHTIYYSPDFYSDALKANGGWSLELTDLGSPCSSEAFSPSADPAGGTPGSCNSVSREVPAGDPPLLLRAGIFNRDCFFCLFSAPLAMDPASQTFSCLLQPGNLPAEPAPSPLYGFPGLFFYLPELIDPLQPYGIELSGTILSCRGDPAVTRPVSFSIPQAPDSAGIVINEIMFDPGPDSPEWIELFNRGTVVVDLKDLIIARSAADGTVVEFSDGQSWSFLLFPGAYAVLTSSVRRMAGVYPDMDHGTLAERSDFPSLTNDLSMLILMDASQTVIDRAIYDPGWHYSYLAETTGVSLERIDPDASGLLQSNWFSASTISTTSTISTISTLSTSSCTPGLPNSQSLNNTSPSLTTPHFSLQNSHLYASTLSDPEPVIVHYTFPETGWFAGLMVYDSRGRMIREVLPLELAGREGVMTWDGLDRELKRVPDGIYLLVAEYRHPSGKSGRWKRACGVVRAH